MQVLVLTTGPSVNMLSRLLLLLLWSRRCGVCVECGVAVKGSASEVGY